MERGNGAVAGDGVAFVGDGVGVSVGDGVARGSGVVARVGDGVSRGGGVVTFASNQEDRMREGSRPFENSNGSISCSGSPRHGSLGHSPSRFVAARHVVALSNFSPGMNFGA